jgi:cytochrome d ubiquinol oxidase subunit II
MDRRTCVPAPVPGSGATVEREDFMEALWFILIALMLTAYVVLDGFDLGAGIIHLMVGRNYDERRLMLQTIGPVWNGNEVWLVAAAGALYFAFPLLYASSFSGFYLSLMIVLWLLILRGAALELRSHLQEPLWWSFFDFVFSVSSLLLAVFYGVALGNVIRGVPLAADHYFFEPLWTDFRVGPNPGILDWFTVLLGALAFATLAVHGAHYVALKTEGDVHTRARRAAMLGWFVLAGLTVLTLVATLSIRPWGCVLPVIVVTALIAMPFFQARGRDLAAFLASTAYITAMLAGAAFMMYPFLLPASTNPAYSLTIYNTRTGAYSMTVGLVWWLIGIGLAVGYFTFLYGLFRGRLGADASRGGE